MLEKASPKIKVDLTQKSLGGVKIKTIQNVQSLINTKGSDLSTIGQSNHHIEMQEGSIQGLEGMQSQLTQQSANTMQTNNIESSNVNLNSSAGRLFRRLELPNIQLNSTQMLNDSTFKSFDKNRLDLNLAFKKRDGFAMTQESIRRPVQQSSLNSNKRVTILHQTDGKFPNTQMTSRNANQASDAINKNSFQGQIDQLLNQGGEQASLGHVNLWKTRNSEFQTTASNMMMFSKSGFNNTVME